MAYNEFAYFYDEFNGEADYDALYAHIHAKLKEHGIQDGILADLGCGTGELTLMLTQADAVRFLQGSCVCVGNGQSQHKAQRQNCRRQPLCRAGGTVLHIEPHPLFFLRPYFTMQKW